MWPLGAKMPFKVGYLPHPTLIKLDKRKLLRYWAILYLHMRPFYNSLNVLLKKFPQYEAIH